MAATKWKMFFDIACPNSWISLKVLKDGHMSKLMNDIELVPIADVKLHLVRTYEARMKRRWERKQQKEESTTPLLQHGELFAKKLPPVEGYMIPDNWEKVHSSALRQGTLLPALFLSSMKHYYPEHFLPAIEVIGERIWEQQLPVHKGAHLFQCSRDAGISFKDSDEIISRLSHVDNRQLLLQNSEEALRLGASSAPFFASTIDTPTVTFSDFHDFKKHLLNS
ncbi:hypothetical protein V3C99_010975 [Haemonchus contortus]|uniref:DSBA domain-containing protein n=1 Tax=Haemonchus contortus TaxID=6289 RepID=A0A7I4Z5Q3_HAECO